MIDFDDLREKVQSTWSFDEASYRVMGAIASGRRAAGALNSAFMFGHVGLHIAKTAGKLAALVEPFGHVGSFEETEHRRDEVQAEAARQVAYMLVNVAKLCSLLGVPTALVQQNLDEYLREDAHPSVRWNEPG